ncbi:TonB-dependent receptor domain-containing protein [Sulfitobacter donghicola]|nr:TonB-dependent receptor [Sulfitobacter donghicola]KIN69622.1 TonB-dependent receptor protein [Sulfitobacter donghicola DSW-25 = KCTC 12864 = JCM 14565]
MSYPTTRAALRATTACVLLISATNASAQEAGVDLGEILLGESKRDVQTDTATAVTEIDQDEIDDRQPGTIAELIDSVPGVNLVNGSTPQGSGINIRGYGANSTFGTDQKVAVVVDGASVGAEEIYRVGTQLFTDPYLYKSAEVIRGTVGSFEYGSGIVGGVVKLETKNASDFTGGEIGFVGTQTLEFSSNGDGITSSTNLAWQPSEQLELLLNYTWRDQDIQTSGNGSDIGGSAFNLPSYLVKGRYTFGENRNQSLTFSYNESNTDETDVAYDTFSTSGGVFGNVDRTVSSRTAALAYNFNPSNDFVNLDVVLSYADQEIDQEYVEGSSTCDDPSNPCRFPGGFPTGGFGTVNADHRYETTKLAIKNTALFETGIISHELRTGLELTRKERLDADSAPGGVDNRVAVYAVDTMQIGSNWTLTPALRYEHSEVTGSTAPNDATYTNEALMGGLSLRYAFDNGFAVFGSAAYTENLPIIDDLGSAIYMTQSEKSRTFELGASYDTTNIFRDGDRFAIKGNLYRTALWDVTSYTVAGSASTRTDSVETEGLELEASYAMESGLYIDLNANIVDGSEFQPSGTVVDWRGVPADTLQLTLGKKFGEELDVSWEMIGNKRFENDSEEVAGSVIHNLRATYKPQQGILEGSEIRFGVENLFDKEYTPRLSTRSATGRNFKVTLSTTF